MQLLSSDIKVTDFVLETLNSARPKFRNNYRVSGMSQFCEREWVLHEKLKKDLYEMISGEERLRMLLGTVMHNVIQNDILGPGFILWGDWECSKCHKIYKDTLMPREVCDCSSQCKTACIWVGDQSKRICQLCPISARYIYREKQVIQKFDKYSLVGHIDGIVMLGNIKRILEIKTVGSESFARLVEPYESHIIQSNLYMHLSGYKECSILYIDRTLVAPIMKEFIVEYDSELALSYIKRLTKLDKLIVNIDEVDFELLPVRICDSKNDVLARRCAYREECFNDELLKNILRRNV